MEGKGLIIKIHGVDGVTGLHLTDRRLKFYQVVTIILSPSLYSMGCLDVLINLKAVAS